MMGFFRTGAGSKLVKNSPDAAEQSATIPVVTDTVEDDTTSAYAQQTNRRNGLKSTLLNKNNRRSTALFPTTEGNTTLG